MREIKTVENKKHGIQLLHQIRDEVMEDWINKVILSKGDLFYDEVQRNALHFYQLLIQYVDEAITEEDLDVLAKKISYERLMAEINIGEFTYNANLGRSTIHHYLLNLDEEQELIHFLLYRINEFFDIFVYKTVQEYSSLLQRSLDKKSQFIEESHKDRLTILGQMSTSFVHEFRNPLTSIMGFVKLLQSDRQDIPYLEIIEHELEQLNFRISQFLLASRREQIENAESFSLKELIDELVSFIYPSLLSGNVEVEEHILDVTLTGVRGEIKQVLLNIFMNSIEALKEIKYEPVLSITVDKDEEFTTIYIQNNGPAIPIEKQSTIFEPFVTTKAFGTGIGLFVCRQIIQKHGGSISCTSNDYRTIFKIILPINNEIEHS